MMLVTVAVASLLCAASHAFRYQQPPSAIPNHYELDDEFKTQTMDSDNAEGVDCFFRVMITGCSSGAEIVTVANDKEMTVTLEGGESEACLSTQCTNSNGILMLSNTVIIGGDASPAIIEQINMDKLFRQESECIESNGDSIVANVQCVEQSTDGVDENTGKPVMNDSVTEIQDTATQFPNWFKATLNVQCGPRKGLYFMQSLHSNYYEDRVFNLKCKDIVPVNFNHCYWTGYQNEFDLPLSAHCGADYIMNGLYSIYSDIHKDRRFSLLCCRAPGYTTKSCTLSDYLNVFDGFMHYAVGGSRVFTGMHSYHIDYYEDRRYKMSSCIYSV